MFKAIKIRLYPTQEQEIYISNLLGCCRFVYNKCLEYKIKEYTENKKSVSFGQLGRYLTRLKNESDSCWLSSVHSKVLQQSLINLESAYKSFFKNGAGFPKFKSKKSSNDSCRFPHDAIGKIKGNRINIINLLKNIHFKCSVRDEKLLNQLQDSIKSGTLSKTKSCKYYFSILLEFPDTEILEKSDNLVGLDVGIKDFIVDSNGKSYENIKVVRKNEKKLKKLHRKLTRKVIDSKNKNKARIKLARFHEKLNNQKNHYLHSVSNEIIKDNQLIVIEDLDVAGMMQNKQMAKSIQELSLFTFKSMLKYKSLWKGRDLIEIDRFFPSSKLCNNCGYKNNDLSLKDREWTCPSCDSILNRDFNAAKNILQEGLIISKIGLSSPELTLAETTGRRSKKET